MGLKRDILIFLSDQHSPLYNKSRGGIVDTPNLDRIQAEGTNFGGIYYLPVMRTGKNVYVVRTHAISYGDFDK